MAYIFLGRGIPLALGVSLLASPGKAGQVQFGPVSFEVPEGFTELRGAAPAGVLTSWEKVEVSRKRMKVFWDGERRFKLRILLLSKDINFPPEKPWENQDYVSAFQESVTRDARKKGWTLFHQEVSERNVHGVDGVEIRSVFENGKRRMHGFCFFGNCGGDVFRLEGTGGPGFPPIWERFLEETSFEGVEIMSPFFWGLYFTLGMTLVLAGFRYDQFRKRRKMAGRLDGKGPA